MVEESRIPRVLFFEESYDTCCSLAGVPHHVPRLNRTMATPRYIASNIYRQQRRALWVLLLLLLLAEPFLLTPKPAQSATRDELRQAKRCVTALYNSKKRMKYRDQWMRCIKAFDSYYIGQPRGAQADEALYTYSRVKEDLNSAIDRLRRVAQEFPKSRFADDAQYQLGEIYLKYEKDPERAYVEFFKVVMDFPTGDMKAPAQKRLEELEAKGGRSKPSVDLPHVPAIASEPSASPLAQVTDIRYWSAPDYTRLVIDVDNQVGYESRLLRADADLKVPRRLYIDVANAQVGPALGEPIPIRDGLLRKARVGQYQPTVVRVVLDIESIDKYKIFSLNDPYRIVVDVTGESRRQPTTPEMGKASDLTLAQQLGLGVKRVVIDPGHGGKDPGALGPRGIREKDVVLAIAKKLQGKLEKELQLEAILTRDSDVYLPLEERTALANTKKADLFVSIHTNANRDREARGLTTYILNVATDAEAARLAAFENAISTKRISDLEKILNELMLNAKINESTRLADLVQQRLIQGLGRTYEGIKDLGVKHAPFYVLIGAQMPCILVETSFISNQLEARRLASSAYQEALAEGIKEGIRSYIELIQTPSRGG
jgi:N-acetylmuramoyl-L-alanine amidase